MVPARWLLLFLLAGCATAPPSRPEDACHLFREQGGWYGETRQSSARWGVPVAVMLAIIHQESRFREDAQPPREKLLWFIPWFRPSSAFGFAQAKDETWDWYQDDTGNRWASRDDFADAVDFVGWYCHKSHLMAGIAKGDAHNLYLAYHEGQKGFMAGSYRDKPWLTAVARKVAKLAETYRAQLAQCAGELGE